MVGWSSLCTTLLIFVFSSFSLSPASACATCEGSVRSPGDFSLVPTGSLFDRYDTWGRSRFLSEFDRHLTSGEVCATEDIGPFGHFISGLLSTCRSCDADCKYRSTCSPAPGLLCAQYTALRHILQGAYYGVEGNDGLSSVPEFAAALNALGNPVQVLLIVADSDLKRLHGEACLTAQLLDNLFALALEQLSDYDRVKWNSFIAEAFMAFGVSQQLLVKSFPSLLAPYSDGWYYFSISSLPGGGSDGSGDSSDSSSSSSSSGSDGVGATSTGAGDAGSSSGDGGTANDGSGTSVVVNSNAASHEATIGVAVIAALGSALMAL